MSRIFGKYLLGQLFGNYSLGLILHYLTRAPSEVLLYIIMDMIFPEWLRKDNCYLELDLESGLRIKMSSFLSEIKVKCTFGPFTLNIVFIWWFQMLESQHFWFLEFELGFIWSSFHQVNSGTN